MLLTEQEVDALRKSLPAVCKHQDVIRAAESAVLEKLKAQKPVAWARFDEDDDNRLCGVLDFENPPLYVTPLYLHPDPRVAELEAVLRECREALLHCEGVFDEVRGYPITYDLTIETIAKIDEVLNEDR